MRRGGGEAGRATATATATKTATATATARPPLRLVAVAVASAALLTPAVHEPIHAEPATSRGGSPRRLRHPPFWSSLSVAPKLRPRCWQITALLPLRGGMDMEDAMIQGLNLTIPSYDEVEAHLKDLDRREAEGLLRTSEATTEEEPPPPEEGHITIVNLPSEYVKKNDIEAECKNFGKLRRFDLEKGAAFSAVTAVYLNVTEAKMAWTHLKKLPWMRESGASVTFSKQLHTYDFEKIAVDKSDHVYSSRFGRLGPIGRSDLNGRKRRAKSTSLERRLRRERGNVKMDLLADFEREKLTKLIRQFPEVTFPDNWCETETGWKLYVGRIPIDVSGEELENTFERFGRISEVHLGASWKGATKQYGFVSFETAEGAARAVMELQGGRHRMREEQAPLEVRFAHQYVTVRRNITGSFQANGDNELEQIAAERYKRAREHYVGDGVGSKISKSTAVDDQILKGFNDVADLENF